MLPEAFKLVTYHSLTKSTDERMIIDFHSVASVMEGRPSGLITSYLCLSLRLEQSWNDCIYGLCTLFKEEAEKVTVLQHVLCMYLPKSICSGHRE